MITAFCHIIFMINFCIIMAYFSQRFNFKIKDLALYIFKINVSMFELIKLFSLFAVVSGIKHDRTTC